MLSVRSAARSVDLSGVLEEEAEAAVKEAAEVSMGTEIAEEDVANISALCEQVVSIAAYRASLFDYLRQRMAAIAPNLTVMVGELVGARLIAHAGSLLSLAKQPASTVQILGAEKALFRALKTKCFPADDHEILTGLGFMSLPAVRAHFASHCRLSIACYVKGGIEYHDITAGRVVTGEGEHTLVRFEAESLPVPGDSGRETGRCNAVSLLATDNHSMFVQLGRTLPDRCWPAAFPGATQSESAPAFRLIDADEVVAAGSRDSSTVVRLTAQFERGLNSADSSVAAFELAEALCLVTDDELMAFMQLYGCWLGCGWLDESKASVSFALKRPRDEERLDGLLARLPLPRLQSATRGARGYWKAADVSSGQLQLHVLDSAWWQLFHGQYGHMPAPPAATDSDSAKCMWPWVWRRTKDQLRALIEGLAMAEGQPCRAPGSCGGSVRSASARFRDELVRVLLHAGYSCTFAEGGEQQGQAGGMHKGWTVSFTEDASAAQPTLSAATEVRRLPQPWQGTVWCVTVPTDEHLIMARRVLEREGELVVRASRPVVVGNSATPKYGLIYHCSLVGQAAPRLKGKVSRMLAAKTALSIRMDALGETEGVSIGLEGREKVESRLKQMEGAAAAAEQQTPGKPRQQQDKYRQPQTPSAGSRRTAQLRPAPRSRLTLPRSSAAPLLCSLCLSPCVTAPPTTRPATCPWAG